MTGPSAAAAALFLVGDGATAAELAERTAGLDIRAALVELAALGLVRVAAGEGETARYVLTQLGQRQAATSLFGQPEVVAAHQELEQLRSDLISAIAHELRTPLTAVRTSVGLLRDPAVATDAAIRERLLQAIAQGAERMQRFVSDILDIARFRGGNVHLQLRRFDARTLAREATEGLLPLLEARGQRLDLALPGAPVWVYGDHRRLEQALVNLLSNAQKFSPDGATVRLAVAQRGDDVVWSVTDHGPGIGAQDRDRLFERFFTSGGDTPGTAGGTGLGLPIALAIAQAHEGTIDVESAPGAGSTFSVRVPAHGPTEPGEL
jgi:signal transduction histidine kinase